MFLLNKPTFIKFRVIPAVAEVGPDQMILQVLYGPRVDVPNPALLAAVSELIWTSCGWKKNVMAKEMLRSEKKTTKYRSAIASSLAILSSIHHSPFLVPPLSIS